MEDGFQINSQVPKQVHVPVKAFAAKYRDK